MDLCMSVAARVMLDEITKSSNISSSKNVVLSPMSITVVLNMVASGSNGKTLEQFLRFLGSKDTGDLNSKSQAIMSLLASSSTSDDSGNGENVTTNDSVGQPDTVVLRARVGRTWRRPGQGGREPEFTMANALWVDHRCPLRPSFLEITQSIYNALVKNVDLFNQAEQVKEEVNSWAEQETKGLIKDVLSPTTQLSPPLCVANALYFKGAWDCPFKASNTRHEDFHLLNGETTKVPFMTMQNTFHSFGSFKDFKILKLAYQRGQSVDKQFSMYIFLPQARKGLKDLVEKFNADATTLHPDNFYLHQEELSHVWLPKMKFSYNFEAQDIMKAKGLTLPFSDGADFSNMVALGDIFISGIVQKSFLEVNEEGTEAAAVTVCYMARACAPSEFNRPKPSFVANHPFMFMIIEDFSKLVVFNGVVLNPLLG